MNGRLVHRSLINWIRYDLFVPRSFLNCQDNKGIRINFLFTFTFTISHNILDFFLSHFILIFSHLRRDYSFFKRSAVMDCHSAMKLKLNTQSFSLRFFCISIAWLFFVFIISSLFLFDENLRSGIVKSLRQFSKMKIEFYLWAEYDCVWFSIVFVRQSLWRNYKSLYRCHVKFLAL